MHLPPLTILSPTVYLLFCFDKNDDIVGNAPASTLESAQFPGEFVTSDSARIHYINGLNPYIKPYILIIMELLTILYQ